MAVDEELNWAMSDSLEVWAPVHAWRTLGQLRAEAAIEPLTSLFHLLDEIDWGAGEELPIVMEMIGPSAIPHLDAYLGNPEYGLFPRVSAAHSIEKIGNRYVESKQRCIEVLTRHLANFKQHPHTLNACLISFLIDLNAEESAPLMEQAFAAWKVDLSVAGDWEDVQIELGLLEERKTAAPNYLLGFDDEWEGTRREELREEQKAFQKKQARKKSKRKIAKKSRKQQRRKKK